MKTVVITGAAGAVGQACMESSVFSGFNVIRCSRKKRIGFYHTESLSAVPNGDVLLHFGEDSNIQRVNDKDSSYVYDSFHELCKLIEKNEYQNIIYLSSSAVINYSECISSIENEWEQLPNYAALKLLVEKRVRELNGCVLRIPNIYGGSVVSDTIWADVLTQFKTGQKIHLRKPNAKIRLLHINDLLSLLNVILKNDYRGLVDLQPGDNFLASDISQYFISCVKGHLKMAPMPRAEDLRVYSKTQNSLNILGWSESIKPSDGIKDFAERAYES